MIHPTCFQSIVRSDVEEPEKKKHQERQLFRDIVQKELDDLINASNKMGEYLNAKLYSTAPFFFLIRTEKSVFIEQYCYKEAKDPLQMPLLKYDQKHITYNLAKETFEKSWGRADGIEKLLYEHNIGYDLALTTSKCINIFKKRGDNSPLTERYKILLSPERINGQVNIMGISVFTFSFGALRTSLLKRLNYIKEQNRNRSSDNQNSSVRVALLNPYSPQAIFRAHKENHLTTMPIAQYSLEDHKKSRLFKDTSDTLDLFDRWIKTDHLDIDVKLYASNPACFLFITPESALIEQYHFGQKEEDKRQALATLAGEIPVLEYKNSACCIEENNNIGDDVYSMLVDHFNYIWEGCSISIKNFKEKERNFIENFEKTVNQMSEWLENPITNH